MTSTAEPQVIAVDANVVIHLSQIDRLALLGELDGFRFVVPQEVVDELIRPESREAVRAALSTGVLELMQPEDVDELALMTELTGVCGVGRGEAACLTLAVSRGWLVATDDEGRRFVREAEARLGPTAVVSTPDLVLLAIQRGQIPVEEADGYPAIWAENDFRVDFTSFTEFLGDEDSADDGAGP